VTQDDVLFTGTIAENISFFDPDATLKRVEEAAALAGIYEEIRALPMGFFSLVGDMGSALSGGQQQRIHLARALYRKPKILVLDEATSHLDVALERSISSSLRGMAITRIVIAHRPETIASADHVFLLNHGALTRLQKIPQSDRSINAANAGR